MKNKETKTDILTIRLTNSLKVKMLAKMSKEGKVMSQELTKLLTEYLK